MASGSSELAVPGVSLDRRYRRDVFEMALDSLMRFCLPFVEKEIEKEYNNLKASHNIHVQSTTGRLQRWTRKKLLKYENINGNDVHPKLPSGSHDYSLFDCRVLTHIDFARLYVPNYTANFSTFRECASSTVLLLLGEVPAFSVAVRAAAVDLLRTFGGWPGSLPGDKDQDRFRQRFFKLEHLVRAMALPVTDEESLLKELNNWKTGGNQALIMASLDFPRIQFPAFFPSYVVARGPRAIAAYQRAIAIGKTLDRRVKVLLIGQDRVGKTSVARSLKGKMFRSNETSTDGVRMYEPLKNPGIQPWKYAIMQRDTTAYHHKCAEYIGREIVSETTANQTNISPSSSSDEQTSPELLREKEYTGGLKPHSATEEDRSPVQEDSSIPVSFLPLLEEKRETEYTGGLNPHSAREEDRSPVQEDGSIPDKIALLLDETPEEEFSSRVDGIWPVIWDFAGQAVYRAIHPIFMSPEAVYVLVFNLTEDLFATAQCKVKNDGNEEVKIPAPDTSDTNVDHILRLLDLVHSLRHPENDFELPPVILVGTHAGKVGIDSHDKKMDVLKKFLMYNARDFFRRIVKRLTVDNKVAHELRIQGEEDPRIVALRQEILSVADTLPHTKNEVPLKWLEVENKVFDHVAEKKEKYMTKQNFKREIVDKLVQSDLQDDLEHLLNFLHDRGILVYHDHPENPDGLIVLDPQWLIEDVLCKIITVRKLKEDEPNVLILRQNLQDTGMLHLELLNHVCKNVKLDHIKDSLLFIMKKFNLLCECKDKDGNSVYFVPCMLTTKPPEDLMGPVGQGSAPVFIKFGTNYVPAGFFSRLLVFFSEWAASRTSCEQQQLYANAARFIVGEFTCLGFVCYKAVVKVHIWAMDNSNPVEKEPEVSYDVSRKLKETLQRLSQECHWLRAVNWDLCGQCKLCPGKVDPSTGKCFWHQERECLHDDCAHYVPVSCIPFCCKDAKGPDLRIPQTWIQALKIREAGTFQQQPDEPPPQKRRRMEKGEVKEGTPSNDELEELSQRIAEAWKPLGRRLEIEEGKLTCFHKENEEYSERAFKMLLHWKERDGSSATYSVLHDALCHKLVNKKLLAEELFCE